MPISSRRRKAARQTRRELFSLGADRTPELLPRDRVLGVKERLGCDGRALTPLTGEEIARVRRRLEDLAPEAVAVCLLHAYAHPAHEERLAAALADLGAPVSLSSRVLPEFREYERTCATVLNAYLGPILARYLEAWEGRLPGVPLFIQQSNGGFFLGWLWSWRTTPPFWSWTVFKERFWTGDLSCCGGEAGLLKQSPILGGIVMPLNPGATDSGAR